METEDDASSLDPIQHVGASGKWWGIVTADGTPDGEPVVHGDGDPAFYDKHPHVHQGAIVENERLAAVLSKIRDDRRERGNRRLASRCLSLRDKERICEAQGQADHV